MSGRTYFKFFPSDWRSGTMTALTLEEEGLYIRGVVYMHDTQLPIPGDDSEAARLFCVQILKYKKVMASLIAKGKFIRAQGAIVNERVMKEIDDYRSQRLARQEAARLREARKRTLNGTIPQGTTPGHTPHLTAGVILGVTTPVDPTSTIVLDNDKLNEINATKADDCLPESTDLPLNQKLETRIVKEKKESGCAPDDAHLLDLDVSEREKKRQRKTAYSQAFEEFWKAYPTKRSEPKPKANGQWKDLLDEDRAQALAAIPAYKRAVTEEHGDIKWCKHAWRYLRDRLFDNLAAATEPWWRHPKIHMAGDEYFEAHLKTAKPNGAWPSDILGPAPGEPGCVFPQSIIDKYQLVEKYGAPATDREDS